MKSALLFTSLFLMNSSLRADHKCNVNVLLQIYDAKTLTLKSFEVINSDWFDVTKQPHEDPKTISLKGKNGEIGEASVWTGTLLGTPEGDVIQANATVKISDMKAKASLVMSVESPMAKAISEIYKETADEIFMAPFDLKCVRPK